MVDQKRKKLKCDLYPAGTLENLRFVVVCSSWDGKWLLSRHRERDTWETQGGHIEPGETPEEAAKRELFEESGVTEAEIMPVCDYFGYDDQGNANGRAFLARVRALGTLPDSEMEEVRAFSRLPDALTYPDVTPRLIREAGRASAAETALPDKPSVLVSACLMGTPCRYDGGCKTLETLDEIAQYANLIPCCPELMGGLPVPRESGEIRNGFVYSRSGRDVTKEYRKGAEAALSMYRAQNCRYALLKDKSPSCGSGIIYGGNFDGKLVSGDGVTAGVFKKAGICVFSSDHWEELLHVLKENIEIQ